MPLLPLTEKQATAIAVGRQYRTTIYEGSIRSGKTITSALGWADYVHTAPAGPLLMVGATRDTLKRNVLDPLTDLFGTSRCTWGADSGLFLGRKVHLIGAPNALAEGRIRGLTLAGAYVDEATLVAEAFWSQLLGRLSVPGARLLATTNPGSPSHYLHEQLERASAVLDRDGRLIDRSSGDNRLPLLRCRFTLDDNIALDPDYVEAIKAEHVGLFYRRFILGDWVAADGAIYDRWDDDLHTVTDADLPRRADGTLDLTDHQVVFDYGTANPFHALLMGYHAKTGAVYVLREWRYDGRASRKQLSDDEYATELVAWAAAGYDGLVAAGALPLKATRVIGDPSAASMHVALHRRAGLRVLPAPNEVLDGIRDVGTLLASTRLLVSKSATHLRREFSGYTWDPKQQDKGIDAPLKVDDHGMDAARYGVRALKLRWSRWQPSSLYAA